MVVGIILLVVFGGAIGCLYTWPTVRKQRLIHVYINQQLTERRRIKTKVVLASVTELYFIKVLANLTVWPGKYTAYGAWVPIKNLVRLAGATNKSASYVIRTYVPCQKRWSKDAPVLVFYSPRTETWSCAIFGNDAQIVGPEGACVPGEQPASFLGRLPLGPLER